MKQIGISIQQTAIIHALLPVSMFIGPPISGYIADKFGGHKFILVTSLILTAIFHTSLLWVPQVHEGANLSKVVVSCENDAMKSNFSLSFPVPDDECSSTRIVRIPFTDCVRQCHHQLDTYYSIIMRNTSTTGSHTTTTTSSNEESLLPFPAICGLVMRSPDRKSLRDVCMSYDNATRHLRLLVTSKNRTLNGGRERVLLFEIRENDSTSECAFAGASHCTQSCAQTDMHEMLLTPDCGSITVTFWLYLVLRVIASIFMSSCFSLFDATTMVLVKQYDADYGKQRIWPILATAIFPPITGFLVDHFTAHDGVPGELNYSPPFYMMDCLLVCTMLLGSTLQVEVTLSSETNIANAARLMKNPRVGALVVTLFILGTMWGYIEVFLYWFLLELGSPTYLLGLTLTVGSGIGVPVLFYSEKIIQKLGHVTIVFAAFMFYSIRYIGYSFIYNPWWCLIFEAMEIFTVHLLWVSVVTYTANIVPKSLLATMQGVVGGTHYGFGRGSGSLIGGLLMEYIGTRNTFRYLGLGAAVCGILFFLFERLFFWKDPDATEKTINTTGANSSENGDKKITNALAMTTTNKGSTKKM